MHPQLSSALDNRKLSLILYPTEDCNFRCSYCYEEHTKGKMSPSVIKAIKRLIDSRLEEPEFHSLSLQWFGGEPLLAQDIIEDMATHVLARTSRRKNFNFDMGITTNAYLLTREVAAQLASLGTTFYQVSLDGDQALHDTTRKRKDGAGTFNVIWKNLLSLRESKLSFHIMLRIHFLPQTYKETARLITMIKKEFGEDRRFSLFLKAIENLGGEKGARVARFHNEEEKQKAHQFLTGLLSADTTPQKENIPQGYYPYQQAYHPSYASLYQNGEWWNQAYAGSSQGIQQTTYGEGSVCYAAMGNSLAIRKNGDIQKCTVALDDPINTVGKLNSDGTITSNGNFSFWLKGILSGDTAAAACPLHKPRPR